ncbi:MAG TPA: hypothetical protein DCX25_02170 [Candidatus Pacebacteria bacterium]|nr:MAG: hypothetical protein UX00_C0007G0115 [Microgenomates group bacterium GW2011_GWB1_45_17]KKU23357.1 MAG: hypothetical protein UX35_C0006G0033 [Microgenomates group bacterium GW2011_GWA1_46_15]KKU24514.1 MAG: hypothetical protein UX36_C0001G0131 [Microgenomates group bacterium GW2011_GWC1_46_15]HAV15111.1 hypothetical protein [Candidatus Paceibacterota bacterium]HCR11062.1 hypothetical protein [Candidatus Paceibacterota bacterium]
MDPLVLTLTIVSSVLAIFLVILGVQAFLTLRDVRATLKRINTIMDVTQNTALRALVPFSNMGGFVTGIKSGLKVFETFVQYLHRSMNEE